ncbi:MAG TPA: hypothetical protein VFC78_02270 [Tepidisphaeraceae bacterium]|nr:hypothetical protein [Tepidisphaeraceae bacterium]
MDETPSSPRGHRPTTPRRTLPLMLSAVGLWLLVGCIYLPIPEHRTDKHQVDFRELVGDAGSKARIQPGHVTRAQVIALLGPPSFMSADRTSIGYTLETAEGLLIYPQCFSAWPENKYSYGLRLTFAPDEVLSQWRLEYVDNGGLIGMEPAHLPDRAIELLNNQRPELLPVDKLSPATRP